MHDRKTEEISTGHRVSAGTDVRTARTALVVLMTPLWLAMALGCAGGRDAASADDVQSTSSALGTTYTLALKLPQGSQLGELALLAEDLKVNDGVRVFEQYSGAPAKIASVGTAGVNVGAGATVGGLASLGAVVLRSGATVNQFIETSGSYTAQAGATLIGSLSQTPQPLALKTLSWKVTYPATSSGSISLEPDQAATKAPGRYGAVTVKSRAVLTLKTGAYYLDSLQIEPDGRIDLRNAAGPVRIFLRGPFTFRGKLTRELDQANVIIASLASAPITIEAPLRASVWAPAAPLTVASIAEGIRGTFVGRVVEIHQRTPVIHEPVVTLECVGDNCAPSANAQCLPGGRFFREYAVNGGLAAFYPTAWTPRPFNVFENTRDWVCYLSRVGGELDEVDAVSTGNTSWGVKRPGASVSIVNDYWVGTAGDGVAASATCVHKSCFSSNSMRIEGPYFASAEADYTAFELSCDSGEATTPAGSLDQATFLSGFNPWEPSGGGEKAWVEQFSTKQCLLRAHDGQCSSHPDQPVSGAAYSFRAGPLGVPALFSGPSNSRTPIEFAGKFTISSEGGSSNQKERLLLPFSEGACYLSSISGKFAGGAEYAKLDVAFNETAGQHFWRLYAQHRSGGEPDGVQAEATCYSWNQDDCTGFTPATLPRRCEPLIRQRFTWEQGQKPRTMGSATDRVCFLTEATGDFQGGGEATRARIDKGAWLLDGQSLQTGIRTSAQCVAAARYSEEFTWTQGAPAVSMGSSTGQACFLTRVTGKFEGGGEQVRTFVENGQWFLGGHSAQKDVAASARCLPVASFTPEINWAQGQQPIILTADPPNPRDFCFLTRVEGKFEGGGESVAVSVVFSPSGSLVQALGGSSRQSGVAGSAVCARLLVDPIVAEPQTVALPAPDCTIGALTSDLNRSQGQVCWMSQVVGDNDTGHPDNHYRCRPASCFQGSHPDEGALVSPVVSKSAGDEACNAEPQKTPLMGFDTIAHLVRFGGAIEGRGEFVRIDQAVAPDARSQMVIHSCQDDGVFGDALSLTFGPLDQQIKFMGPGDIVGPLNVVGEFHVDSATAVTTQVMTPVATTQCFITETGGKFPGGGESIVLEPKTVGTTQRWTLTAKHLSGGGVFATARCFPLDQNPTP